MFSSWLYVVHKGQFSSAKTVIAYYSTFTIIMIFNSFLNKSKHFWSKKNLIGKPTHNIYSTHKKGYVYPFSGIFLNSASSVLSYNNFNFEYIIDTGKTNQYFMYSKL